MKREIVTIKDGIVNIPQSVDIWMTQHEIAYLLDCFISKVNTNIHAILKSEVLDKTCVCRTHRYENGDLIEQYNLEMIMALSFRIKSPNATSLRRYMMKKAISDTGKRQLLMIRGWNRHSLSPN